MPNNTYKGDIGAKHKAAADHDEPGEKAAGEVLADKTSDDEDDSIYGGGLPRGGEADAFEDGGDGPEYSALSDTEREYIWEKPLPVDDELYEPAPKPKREKNARKRGPESDDDENYDFEIGNNAAGLKILMGLMLIIFIVIISVLVYRLTLLTDSYQNLQTQLSEAPTMKQLNDAKAELALKDQAIKQLNAEISQYKVDKAPSGQLIETPEGSVYVVASGDSLGKIAQIYQVSINQIMEWNNMDNADNIKIGQKLIVKKAGNTTTTAKTD